jgi:hypothetical protein
VRYHGKPTAVGLAQRVALMSGSLNNDDSAGGGRGAEVAALLSEGR